jgi:hypothetical protein
VIARHRTHEFGDSLLVERRGWRISCSRESTERAAA